MGELPVSMEPEIFTVQANGLSFACSSDGEGPLALVVHGFPDTPRSFSGLRGRMAGLGYRVVTPYTRGYFPTHIPHGDAYTYRDLGEDLLGLIDALGAERAVIVGHDWGAVAGYAAAHLDPHRVGALVTLAIAPTP